MPDSEYPYIEPGDISIITPDHPVQIMEGCTLMNESRTKYHKVKASDKHILLKEPGNRVTFDVMLREKDDKEEHIQDELVITGRPIYITSYFNQVIVPDSMIFAPAPYNFYDRVIQPKSRGCLIKPESKSEERALESLREMISEEEFRRYLKYGFITVESFRGKVYQIFQNNNHVKVWDNGRLIEEVCIYLKNRRIPLTDKVIAFKAIIETDEDEFRSMGNIYNLRKKAA